MKAYVLASIATMVTMLVMDFAWLGFVAKPFYDSHLGALVRPQPYWPAVVIFYMFYVAAILLFAVFPSATLGMTVMRAAGLGLVAYGTYDLTNWAVLRDWPAILVPVDMAWGLFLTTTAAVVGKVVFARAGVPL